MPFEPHQSLAGCIPNIRRRVPACDRVIADYSSERPCRNAHCGQGVRGGGWTRSVEILT
jgi:hypothetical protein